MHQSTFSFGGDKQLPLGNAKSERSRGGDSPRGGPSRSGRGHNVSAASGMPGGSEYAQETTQDVMKTKRFTAHNKNETTLAIAADTRVKPDEQRRALEAQSKTRASAPYGSAVAGEQDTQRCLQHKPRNGKSMIIHLRAPDPARAKSSAANRNPMTANGIETDPMLHKPREIKTHLSTPDLLSEHGPIAPVTRARGRNPAKDHGVRHSGNLIAHSEDVQARPSSAAKYKHKPKSTNVLAYDDTPTDLRKKNKDGSLSHRRTANSDSTFSIGYDKKASHACPSTMRFGKKVNASAARNNVGGHSAHITGGSGKNASSFRVDL